MLTKENDEEEKKDRRRKLKLYTTTRIKSRNFLSNILYNGVKEEDLYDRHFIFDVYVLMTKNLNLFSLEREIFDINNREIVRMLWEECIDQGFYKFACEKENFMYLNRKNFLYPGTSHIVWSYIEKDEIFFERMRKSVISHKKIFQYVYAK